MSRSLFSALLKYWRERRGLSQLDLALAAGISARHVCFLETGRSKPTEGTARRLLATLDLPLRERDEALRAAGFDVATKRDHGLPRAIDDALDRMLAAQEPYPSFVVSLEADIVRRNRATEILFPRFVASPERLERERNMFSIVFDDELMRPFVVNWEQVARDMLARAQQEALRRGDGELLRAVTERAMRYPGVPEAWRGRDFAERVDPTFTIRLARDGVEIGFFTTITTFSAPQSVELEELRIESAFPIDDATRRYCEAALRDERAP